MEYTVRWAKREEWDAAISLIWKTFLRFDAAECTEQGIQSFRDFIMDPDLKHSFYEGGYELLVALDGDRIVGAASLRSVTHLSLLFVEESHHRRGIGRSMMETLMHYLLTEVGEHYLSLLASPYALEFYKKLGFTQVGPMTSPSGIPVVKMEKVF
ncbi:MAG: GNAT family N-acetyltransferase [Lachnospiraceae bacterium]|nr:GNAT family N-acetyltransferase [Lachnospiraceae bacterium]MBQ2101625.1 GNAT family N-acetyltransferase [Lachnospiraceae bacterium]MBQ3907261.1 GNAT family N-acetyltransferase [Lachnospiraceae bacterium]